MKPENKTVSPAPEAADANPEVFDTLTEKEMRGLIKIFACMKNKLEIDYEKFQLATGWAKGTCTNFLSAVRKKGVFDPAVNGKGPDKKRKHAEIDQVALETEHEDDEHEDDEEEVKVIPKNENGRTPLPSARPIKKVKPSTRPTKKVKPSARPTKKAKTEAASEAVKVKEE
ncbi:uncharacterized protein E0L32_000722 [Thyridium curvatum]|uniref:Uncharacterized protein n=1 Tax=Thyridium curvatum TaxID=1093900 RepID=A0A507ANW4_9PEZI|nr:uncharacterized protein E0L32_000722 [Thyridium curvatum]TPX12545.1 hypothetical protein E0L32_000722 [Thyridium curvatum]